MDSNHKEIKGSLFDLSDYPNAVSAQVNDFIIDNSEGKTNLLIKIHSPAVFAKVPLTLFNKLKTTKIHIKSRFGEHHFTFTENPDSEAKYEIDRVEFIPSAVTTAQQTRMVNRIKIVDMSDLGTEFNAPFGSIIKVTKNTDDGSSINVYFFKLSGDDPKQNLFAMWETTTDLETLSKTPIFIKIPFGNKTYTVYLHNPEGGAGLRIINPEIKEGSLDTPEKIIAWERRKVTVETSKTKFYDPVQNKKSDTNKIWIRSNVYTLNDALSIFEGVNFQPVLHGDVWREAADDDKDIDEIMKDLGIGSGVRDVVGALGNFIEENPSASLGDNMKNPKVESFLERIRREWEKAVGKPFSDIEWTRKSSKLVGKTMDVKAKSRLFDKFRRDQSSKTSQPPLDRNFGIITREGKVESDEVSFRKTYDFVEIVSPVDENIVYKEKDDRSISLPKNTARIYEMAGSGNETKYAGDTFIVGGSRNDMSVYIKISSRSTNDWIRVNAPTNNDGGVLGSQVYVKDVGKFILPDWVIPTTKYE